MVTRENIGEYQENQEEEQRLELTPIRYFAIVGVDKKTWYKGIYGEKISLSEEPDKLGKTLAYFLAKEPTLPLINGPEVDWNEKDYQDSEGEYQLRPLNLPELRRFFSGLSSMLTERELRNHA